jgi:hypothetical protein
VAGRILPNNDRPSKNGSRASATSFRAGLRNFLKIEVWHSGSRHRPASRFIPATAISAASALPSSFTRANSAAFAGQRLIASDLAASLAPSRPGGMPTARFQAAGAIASDDLREQRPIHRGPIRGAVAQDRHVGYVDEIAGVVDERQRASRADVNPDGQRQGAVLSKGGRGVQPDPKGRAFGRLRTPSGL